VTAIACLKVFVGQDLCFADSETMAALVAKVGGAYLESTWAWPRRHGLVAPFSFVLADPRATRLDARELQALARELQKKLFGGEGDGDITLLMFEGGQTEVMRFASTHAADLRALLLGQDSGQFPGRVCKITPTQVISITPTDGPIDGAPPNEDLAALTPGLLPSSVEALFEIPTPAMGWLGVYHLAKERFVGNGVSLRATWGDSAFGETEDADITARDLVCLTAAAAAIDLYQAGHMFLPFSFSSMVKPTMRAAYRPQLERLPRMARGRLVAQIYDVPSEPTFGAIKQIRHFLEPHVANINLQVRDPGFRIESLSTGAVNAVTLVLCGDDERARLSAISRFMSEASAYRSRQMWQGVAGLRSQRELELCQRLRARFLSGPIVAPVTRQPSGNTPCRFASLPYRAATVASLH
jgi:hypothetical protein